MWPLWRHLLSCLKIRRVSGEKDHETGTPVLVGMENFENEKTQTSDSRGGSFCPVSGSADIFPVFRRRNGAQPRREGRIFLQPDLFKEIRRFLLYRNILGWRAVFLNIFGNVLAFMPFGFFLPVIWVRTRHWYITVLLSFVMSLLVETMQLVGKVGSFDVDDLLLNTIGGFAGYIIFVLARGVWERYSGTNRK